MLLRGPSSGAEVIDLLHAGGKEVYFEIRSSDPLGGLDGVSFGSFTATSPNNNPEDLDPLRRLFDEHVGALPEPTELERALSGLTIYSTFGIDFRTSIKGYATLYNELNKDTVHDPQLILIPISEVSPICKFSHQVAEKISEIRGAILESDGEFDKACIAFMLEEYASRLQTNDSVEASQALDKLFSNFLQLPKPDNVYKNTSSVSSLADLLDAPEHDSLNPEYARCYQELSDLITKATYIKVLFNSRTNKTLETPKEEPYFWMQSSDEFQPECIRWFIASPFDTRGKLEIGNSTNIPTDIIDSDHPNFPNYTHPKECNQIVLISLKLTSSGGGIPELTESEIVLIYDDTTLVSLVVDGVDEVQRVKNEILSGTRKIPPKSAPHVVATLIIGSNLHKLQELIHEVDRIVTEFTEQPISIPSDKDLEETMTYRAWLTRLLEIGLDTYKIVPRMKEQKSHYDRVPPSSEHLSAYQTIAEAMTKKCEISLGKLDTRLRAWDTLIDRQDSSLNLKLTALAGIVIPATLASGIFGQNIAGSTGFPGWLVYSINALAFLGGAGLTLNVLRKKNSNTGIKNFLQSIGIGKNKA